MKILITGGAGFIGINCAEFYLNKGWKVTIFDNFSRKNVEKNIRWIKKHKNVRNLKIVKADIRSDISKIDKEIQGVNLILHLAAQVAVTTSVINPEEDFYTNAIGTFNLLESVRKSKYKPVIIYASTNKVYGGLEDHKISETATRYKFKNLPKGVDENQNLDFHSPYGCSKGAADQYVRDYARIYGLNTIVFRQSCIYGERQFGVEDQGWIAWFIIALTLGKKITIYGTGKQVRDILYVKDLISAYHLAYKNIKKTKGNIYNIGGGPKNTISVWFEFVPLLEKVFGRMIDVKFKTERPGDQPIYISNIKKAEKDFGWKPKMPTKDGILQLARWVDGNKELFQNS